MPFELAKTFSETSYGLLDEISIASRLRGLRTVLVFPAIRPDVRDVRFAHLMEEK